MPLRITTTAFQSGGTLPVNFTRDGANKSPALHWDGAPKDTKCFVLMVEDVDTKGDPFLHWMLYDIPAERTGLDAELSRDAEIEDGIKQGKNDFGELGFDGPAPPAGKKHQYVFRLFALSRPLGLPPGAVKEEVQGNLQPELILERAEISAFYKNLERKRKVA